MKKRYKNILEKVYEVEGLLLLAMSKEDTPEGLDELIERRLAELMDDEENEKDAPAVEQIEERPEPAGVASEVSATPEVQVKEVVEAAPEEEVVEAAPEEEVVEEEPDDTFYTLEDEEEYARPASRAPFKEKTGHKPPVFSLNDRFLFTRELFEGDAASFNAALNRIAASAGFGEASDYLAREWGLKPDDSETDGRFLEIVEQYFITRDKGNR